MGACGPLCIFPPSGGSSDTASNIGAGDGEVFSSKVGSDFQFKTILAGAGVTVVNNPDTVEITAAAGGLNFTGDGGNTSVLQGDVGSNAAAGFLSKARGQNASAPFYGMESNTLAAFAGGNLNASRKFEFIYQQLNAPLVAGFQATLSLDGLLEQITLFDKEVYSGIITFTGITRLKPPDVLVPGNLSSTAVYRLIIERDDGLILLAYSMGSIIGTFGMIDPVVSFVPVGPDYEAQIVTEWDFSGFTATPDLYIRATWTPEYLRVL